MQALEAEAAAAKDAAAAGNTASQALQQELRQLREAHDAQAAAMQQAEQEHAAALELLKVTGTHLSPFAPFTCARGQVRRRCGEHSWSASLRSSCSQKLT